MNHLTDLVSLAIMLAVLAGLAYCTPGRRCADTEPAASSYDAPHRCGP